MKNATELAKDYCLVKLDPRVGPTHLDSGVVVDGPLPAGTRVTLAPGAGLHLRDPEYVLVSKAIGFLMLEAPAQG